MYDASLELSLLNAACRWSVFFASRAPRPLFAAPAFLFHLTPQGVPARAIDAFLTRYEVVKHAPDHLLQRSSAPRQPTPPSGVVLCYAIDADGDVHAEPEQLPARLLVYLHVPHLDSVSRRLLSINPDARHAHLEPDQVLPFDLRFLPTLSAAGAPPEAPAHSADLRVH